MGEGLVFKGGTSLSKAYNVIQRFSEDVDLTYDIRRLLPDLAGAPEDPVPETRAEERRWSREVQRLLPLWVEGEVGPMIEARLAADDVIAAVRIEGAKPSSITPRPAPERVMSRPASCSSSVPAQQASRVRRALWSATRPPTCRGWSSRPPRLG